MSQLKRNDFVRCTLTRSTDNALIKQDTLTGFNSYDSLKRVFLELVTCAGSDLFYLRIFNLNRKKEFVQTFICKNGRLELVL